MAKYGAVTVTKIKLSLEAHLLPKAGSKKGTPPEPNGTAAWQEDNG